MHLSSRSPAVSPRNQSASVGSSAASPSECSACTIGARSCGDASHDLADLLAPPVGDGIDQPTTLRREADRHLAPVHRRFAPLHESFRDQPVAQPGDGRGVDGQRFGEPARPLRAPAGQHHQRPVLREGHVVVDRGQRPHGHRHQHPGRPEHGVDHLVVRDLHTYKYCIRHVRTAIRPACAAVERAVAGRWCR